MIPHHLNDPLSTTSSSNPLHGNHERHGVRHRVQGPVRGRWDHQTMFPGEGGRDGRPAIGSAEAQVGAECRKEHAPSLKQEENQTENKTTYFLIGIINNTHLLVLGPAMFDERPSHRSTIPSFNFWPVLSGREFSVQELSCRECSVQEEVFWETVAFVLEVLEIEEEFVEAAKLCNDRRDNSRREVTRSSWLEPQHVMISHCNFSTKIGPSWFDFLEVTFCMWCQENILPSRHFAAQVQSAGKANY